MSATTIRIALPVQPGANIANYLRALKHLGAEGAVIHDIGDAAGYDGLLLPGGWDADPALYGQENRGSMGIDPALDALQLKALALFTKAEKPVLGICRGIQMIDVFFGGTLIQHLPTSHLHSRDEGSPDPGGGGIVSGGPVRRALCHQQLPPPGRGPAGRRASGGAVVRRRRDRGHRARKPARLGRAVAPRAHVL